MSKYQALIDALKAGPTGGKWNWDCDPVKNDPIGRTRYRVTTIGKTVAQIYYSSYEGGPTNAAQDAAYIAAANPDTIRSLLADLERAEKDAERYRWLRAEHERHDPVCHLSWKQSSDRDGSEWVNTANLDAAIDAALSQLKGVQ